MRYIFVFNSVNLSEWVYHCFSSIYTCTDVTIYIYETVDDRSAVDGPDSSQVFSVPAH